MTIKDFKSGQEVIVREKYRKKEPRIIKGTISKIGRIYITFSPSEKYARELKLSKTHDNEPFSFKEYDWEYEMFSDREEMEEYDAFIDRKRKLEIYFSVGSRGRYEITPKQAKEICQILVLDGD